MFGVKLKGATLLSTLAIALILFTTCSLLLLTFYYSKTFEINTAVQARLDNNLQSAIQLSLSGNAGKDVLPFDKKMDLYGDGEDSAFIHQELWGCFKVSNIQVHYKGRKDSATFLCGATEQKYSDACLYLTDNKRRLSLIGNTLIHGKVYLPKAGVQADYLNQEGYTREKLIEGFQDTSDSKLPDISTQFKNFCNSLNKTMHSLADSGYDLNAVDSLYQSFNDSVAVIRGHGAVQLDHKRFSGKIILVSDSLIQVSNSCILNNVLLIAPQIRFQSGFAGAVQAFAMDSIVVEEGCFLNYPSALTVVQKDSATVSSQINIYDNSQVNGCIYTLKGSNEIIYPRIHLNKSALVNGFVYSNGFLYLNGNVSGTVYTDYFVYTESVYTLDNTLKNDTIRYSDWSKLGGFFSPIVNNKNNKILAWLKNEERK